MQIRCNKDYKSTNPHKRGAINEKNTKNVNEDTVEAGPHGGIREV
jgi:hypothetical protein